jgi:hypothetical protein
LRRGWDLLAGLRNEMRWFLFFHLDLSRKLAEGGIDQAEPRLRSLLNLLHLKLDVHQTAPLGDSERFTLRVQGNLVRALLARNAPCLASNAIKKSL